MPNVAEIKVALPAEMLEVVDQAVQAGEYSSSSEIVADALTDWIGRRALRSTAELKQLWDESVQQDRPRVNADEVFDRLERRYQTMIEQASGGKNSR